MKLLVYIFLSLVVVSCSSTSSNNSSVELCRTDSASLSNRFEYSVCFSHDTIVLKDLIFGHNIIGTPVKLRNFKSLDYDIALVSGDTLIVVTKREKVVPLFDFNDIRKPMTEKQIIRIMGDEYKVLKTVEDSEMENNTDGNYEPPYLFLLQGRDSIQYFITFPYDKAPYTYEFCEAVFYRESHNVIANKIFNVLSELQVEEFARKYPFYKNIWLIQTGANYLGKEVQKHEWSIFIKIYDAQIERVLLTIDDDAIIEKRNMAEYMFGL